MALVVEKLGKNYQQLNILRNLSVTVEKGEFCCITGPSGCGKSTLLRLIAGLESSDTGRIIVDGSSPSPGGREIGFVFQEDTLFPWLTIKKNITFPLELSGMKREKREELAAYFLRLTNLQQFGGHYPHQLSGGMKQRVAVARALAYKPKVVLMDEPFAALDAQTRNYMQQQLIELWEHEKLTIVFVTHNIDEALYLADRVLVLTGRPAGNRQEFLVKLPRPRQRTSLPFVKLREQILSLMAN
ncbi:ABC transporter ATP-binding protein [Metallumcola ferriviriculae]|uniref:ABC-type quaternary amine transporter n=1 Tax=Metallumcola ferriviriculae TaxID=3039180 RepID=A0AAU0US56_9FIRM|nr:ABC transporter ATP-binding protein [Desulfitibacteraceae bacterium MK1]